MLYYQIDFFLFIARYKYIQSFNITLTQRKPIFNIIMVQTYFIQMPAARINSDLITEFSVYPVHLAISANPLTLTYTSQARSISI